MQTPGASDPKAATRSLMPLVNRLLRSGQDSAKISVKTKASVKIGARKKKLRSAFGGGT